MRLIFSLLCIILFISCTSNSSAIPLNQKTKLEKFIDSFDKKNPNYTQYDYSEKTGDSLFQASFISGCEERNLLKDYPLRFSDIGKSIAGKYFAHFTNLDQSNINPKIYIDIVLPVSPEAKDTFTKDKKYILTNVKVFRPANDVWQYNISLPDGITHYTIRQNDNVKVILLSLSYVEADIINL